MNNGLIFFLGILTGIVLTGMIWIISEKEKIFGLQFLLNKKGLAVIDELKERTEAASREEVIRTALTFLWWGTEHIKNGREIVVMRSEDQVEEGEEEEEEEFVLTKEEKKEKGIVIKITSIEDVKDLPTSDN